LLGKGTMRAFDDIIRISAERLTSRQAQGWLTPRRSRALVISMLGLGFALVVVWAATLVYFLYRLIAWMAG
jgi:hypothetical protein